MHMSGVFESHVHDESIARRLDTTTQLDEQKQFRSFTLFASDDSNSSETSLADEKDRSSFVRSLHLLRTCCGRIGADDKARTHADNDFAHIFWQTVCLSATLRRTHDSRETRRYILHFLRVLTSYNVHSTTCRCRCRRWCHWMERQSRFTASSAVALPRARTHTKRGRCRAWHI